MEAEADAPDSEKEEDSDDMEAQQVQENQTAIDRRNKDIILKQVED